MLIYFWERERERESEHEWGRGRERGRQNPKQSPGSELSAQSPTQGSNSQTARSWLEPKSDAQPTEPPRYPVSLFFIKPTITKEISVFLFFFNVYFWEREHKLGRGRERGRQNLKRAPASELSAQSLMQGLNSQIAKSWPEAKSDV